MRILVFSQAAWNTANSVGNTVTNWFDGWEDTSFFHFYARDQKPNTDIVEKYYHVSAVEILKKTLIGKQAGRILEPSDIVEKKAAKDTNAEQKQIAKLHKSSSEITYWGMEQVWRSRKWINKTFDEFIEEANPDIIFGFATSPYILEPAIKHIKKKRPSVKIAFWIADDILSGYEKCSWYRRGYLRKGIDYCINSADKLYGASVEMCEKYSKIYKKEVTPLYKGCMFDKPVKVKNNIPLRLVYAGNLLYGRDETLKEIIKALKMINAEGVKAILKVYSNTHLDDEEINKWFDEKNAFYMGVRSYDEIKVIMNEADIVFHVESFREDQKEIVKYSFSTKIIDCLQSGSAVVGIGPANIASIEYLRKVNGAVVIDDPGNIFCTLSSLIGEQNSLTERARSIHNFAVENHEIGKVRKTLRREFESLLSK